MIIHLKPITKPNRKFKAIPFSLALMALGSSFPASSQEKRAFSPKEREAVMDEMREKNSFYYVDLISIETDYDSYLKEKGYKEAEIEEIKGHFFLSVLRALMHENTHRVQLSEAFVRKHFTKIPEVYNHTKRVRATIFKLQRAQEQEIERARLSLNTKQ